MAGAGVPGRYSRFLGRHARVVLGVAGVLTAVAVPFALRLDGATVDTVPASPGTRSEREALSLGRSFPVVLRDRETVYLRCRGSAAFDDCRCRLGGQDCAGFRRVVDALRAAVAAAQDDIITAESYFDYAADPGLRPLLGRYWNATARAMLVALVVDTERGGEKAAQGAVRSVQRVVDGFAGDAAFEVRLTGRLASLLASEKEIGRAIGLADGAGSVIIVLLFGWRVGSWRLTMIPVVNTLVCLMLAEALCLPLATSGTIVIASWIPKVCLFLCIALSVDYSFFHLSRFQELRGGSTFQGAAPPLPVVVEGMVASAGRVVLVSGVVLLFTWLALGFFPVFGVNALGYCASVTIFCCISVNMVLNPALILAFPAFFGRAAQDPTRCCRRRRVEESLAPDPLAQARSVEHNGYGRLARLVTRRPYNWLVPCLIYAIFTPAAIALFTARLSVGGVVGGTDSAKRVAAQVARDFPASASGAPLLVLLASANGVKNEDYFVQGCALARSLSHELHLPMNSIQGAMLSPGAGGGCLDWATAERWLGGDGIYPWAWRRSVDVGNSTSLLTILPPYDTFSNEAKDLVTSARRVVDAFAATAGDAYSAESYHPMGVEVDAEALVAGRFPWVIAATVVIVFAVIGIRYRAALVPVKLLFTIAWPILFVLGCGVFVFQDGWLNWTRVPSLQKQGGLVWINPVACSFMLIGFALDYDLFLFSRIFDERKRHIFVRDRDAIIHSVATTGPVITTAGLIMALAFSGMVVQHDNPFLCQMGFTMILGVLVDTFVVRTVLVPALLVLAGRWNWWPGTMPSEPSEMRGHREVFAIT